MRENEERNNFFGTTTETKRMEVLIKFQMSLLQKRHKKQEKILCFLGFREGNFKLDILQRKLQ